MTAVAITLLVLVQFFYSSYQNQFSIYWNLHTQHCYRNNFSLPLDDYGILYNEGHSFRGNNIVIFYEYSFGLFPYYKNYNLSQPINGGLPQLIDFDEHLEKVKQDVEEHIPQEDFAGIAVIDFEEWRPLFSMNWGAKNIYRRRSIELVKQRSPYLSDAKAKQLAKEEFEHAAKKIFVETMTLCREMRPLAKWGFYGFPYCNYNAGKTKNHQCSSQYQKFNNLLSPIFNAGNALYPSIYLSTKKKENQNYVIAILKEAVRINVNAPERFSIYAYTKFEYNPYEQLDSFYSKDDICNTVKQPVDLGVDGLVLWSTSHNMVHRCSYLASYISEDLGPIIDLIRKRAHHCRNLRCSNNGKCVTDRLLDKCSVKLNPEDYRCQCDQYYYGEACEMQQQTNFLFEKKYERYDTNELSNELTVEDFYYLEHEESLGITEEPLQLDTPANFCDLKFL